MDATIKEIKDKNKIIYLEKFKYFIFLSRFYVALPSTIIKLDIAFTKVSTVEMVNAKPNIITTIESGTVCFFNNNVKKPRSGLVVGSIEKATIPENPM